MVHLKKVIIIKWKLLIMTCLIALALGVIELGVNAFRYNLYPGSGAQTNSYQYDPPQGSHEWLYKDALKIVLLPYVQDAVSYYYEENTGYYPIVDPWTDTDIISVERAQKNALIIIFEVSPYLGAHNSIGIDHVKLKISPSGRVNVEEFEHIKSYPIPPWLSMEN